MQPDVPIRNCRSKSPNREFFRVGSLRSYVVLSILGFCVVLISIVPYFAERRTDSTPAATLR